MGSLRRLCCLLALTALLAAPATAWAADGGRIDHVESRHGQVALLFSIPALAAGSVDPASVRVELDGKPVKALVRSASQSSGTIARTAVLAIDVSHSMAGASFDEAKRAALTFIAQAPSDLRIGVVAFANQVRVLDKPTTDRRPLARSINALQLSLGTSLYKGVLEAVTASGTTGLRDILVLSDGEDTTGSPLSEVTRAVRATRTRVDVVALGQQGSARSALEGIAAAGHGTVIDASQPAALNQVFAAEAAAFARQLLISFPVPRDKAGNDASVAVSAKAGDSSYADTAVVALSAAAPAPPPSFDAAAPTGFVIGGKLLAVGVIALGVGVFLLLLLVFGVLGGSADTTIERRLAAYGRGGHAAAAAAPNADASVRQAAVSVAEKALGTGSLSARLTKKLDGAGLPLTAAEWLLLHVGIAVLAAVVGAALGRGSLPLLLLCLAVGVAGPWLYLGVKRSRRLKRFQAQLAPTLQVMSGSLSAGLSLAQSVETVGREAGDPISAEFRRALVEQRLGIEIEAALQGVAERMDSKDFAWMVMAVGVQREVGGNLAELLNTVSATLRERQYLRRQVSTLSAEGRLSGWIIGGLPPVFVVYLAIARPEYLSPMLHSSIGLVMLTFAAILMTIGAFWLRKTVRIDV
jgi:tight adherence protein B